MPLINVKPSPTVLSLSALLVIEPSKLLAILQNFKKHYRSCENVLIKGKLRKITVPSPELQSVLKKIKRFIVKESKFPDSMHGYMKGRSIITNAKCHAGKKFLANYDIKDFFPSVHHTRVLRIYKSLGLDDQQAQILTTLSTINYSLPQGFPTSSPLAVLALTNLDRRFQKAFEGYDFDYTFYSDDITISANKKIIGFEKLIIKMFRQEGFSIKHSKKKYSGNYQRQTATGIVVNEKISIPIEKRELLKAILNNCVVDGPNSQINKYWQIFGETKSREKSKTKFQERLLGMIKRVSTLNKSYGQRLKRRYNQIDWNK